MPRTTFSEADAADVLGRAARLQAERDQRPAAHLTLDDLKEAAAAAGIAPEFVEHAARMPAADGPDAPPHVGVPVGVRRTRLVEGSVDAAAWGRIVADLRRTLGGQGTVEEIGGIRSWYRAPLRVTAEPAGAFTRVTATAGWGGEARFYVGLTVALLLATLGTGIAAVVGGDGPFSVITAAYLVLAALSASQAWPRYRAKAARVGRKFDAALDRIEAAVRAEGTETTRHAEPAPRPLLDLEDEPAADAAPALRGRTRA